MTEHQVLLISVLAFAGLIVASVLIFLRQGKIRRRSRQALGLQLFSSLRVLLTHIQQHRGLSNGYLHGSHELISEIEGLQKKVSRNIADVATIDPRVEENELWQGITQHWARLAGNYKRLESDNNFAQHNQLIKNLLYLIDGIAQRQDLLQLRNRDQKPLHLFWRELLSAAEYTGQARAVGTGVAAAAYCDDISRVRLQYLCRHIESHCHNLWSEIDPVKGAPEAVSRLIEAIELRVMKDAPDISASEYFAIATEAIDNLLNQFDQLIKQQQWD